MRGEEWEVINTLFQETFLAKSRAGGIRRVVLFSKGSTYDVCVSGKGASREGATEARRGGDDSRNIPQDMQRTGIHNISIKH